MTSCPDRQGHGVIVTKTGGAARGSRHASGVRPVILYLHGFASSPDSHKGKAFAAHLGEHGYALERLDLRLPTRDGLRVSAMIDHVVDRAGRHERVALIGSSLGGLVAARAAMSVDHCIGLVLMAPAFELARRWAEGLGQARLRAWQGGELIEVEDHAGGAPLAIDYGFYQDALAVDGEPFALEKPALVIHGRGDETVPFAGSEALVEGALHARLVALDDDHALIASLPVILDESLDFIDRLWRTET